MKLYILLPVHNRCAVTRQFLGSLLRQSFTDWHLVVVDDGSVDGTPEMVAELVPSATIIKGDGSLWWGGALQAGVRWLQRQEVPEGAALLIINDDTEFGEDFLQASLDALLRRPGALIKPCVYSADGRLLDGGVHVNWQRLSCEQELAPERINCLSTRGLFMRLSDLKRIGGFYPRLLPHLLSDYEFTIRARRKGLRLICLTDPALVSPEGENTVPGRGGTLRERISYLSSYKSYENPRDWFFFMLLAAPWRHKLRGAAVAVVRGLVILSGIERYIKLNGGTTEGDEGTHG